MSGFEIAGIVLGGFPLLISACEHYKKGFEPLLKWKRFKRDFIGFIDAVDTERLLFDQMIRRLLLSTDAISDEELHSFMTIPNYEGWQQKEVVRALLERLGPSYDVYMSTIKSMRLLMLDLQSLLLLNNGEVEWADEGASKWDYQMKRINLSFSKKGPRTVASLENHNRKLRELLDSNDKLDSMKSTRKDTTWANIFECIRRHASSIHTAIMSGWCCDCAPHMTALRLEQRSTGDWNSSFSLAFSIPKDTKAIVNVRREVVMRVRRSKTQVVSGTKSAPLLGQNLGMEHHMVNLRRNFESPSPSPSADENTRPALSTASSSASNASSHVSLRERLSKGVYQTTVTSVASNESITHVPDKHQKRFWSSGKVKVKKQVRLSVVGDITTEIPIRPAPLPVQLSEEVLKIKKIEDLCSAMRWSGLDSDCLGYLSDGQHEHELCPVFSAEPPAEDSYISLEALLSGQEGIKLSRQQRYTLASILASSLLQLQTTEWLAAEKMDKRSIFFYRRGSKILIEYPYIRHAFPSTKSCAPVKEQTVNRFAVRNSLTNLGILLLELCFGQTIENQDIRKHYLGPDGKPHDGTDFMTARDWAEIVAEEEPAFEQIVRSCIFCTFEEKADWENKKFTQAVYTSVVEPLDKVIAKWAKS